MWAPLQKLINPIKKGVGEGPCALPQEENGNEFLSNQQKNGF